MKEDKELIITKIMTGYLVTDTNKYETMENQRHFEKLEDLLTFIKNHYS